MNIPKRKVGDLIGEDQIYMLIDKQGKGTVVMAMDGPYPDPDAHLIITLRAARSMVAEMEAALDADMEDVTTDNIDIGVYDHPESVLH